MQYLAPLTLDDAVDALRTAAGKARVMAGGTDLIVRAAVAGLPTVLLDLKQVPELMALQQHADGSFTVGAAVCGADIYMHPQLRRAWPGVTEAMDLIGSAQIQNRASLGGNLCNASPAADSVPALIAARARCRVIGPLGEREIQIEDVIIAPGKTCLRADEIVVSFLLPARPANSADAYLRMTPRTEMDIAVAGAAASLVLDEQGLVEHCHVALGAVSPVPLLAVSAVKVLSGTRLEEEIMSRFRRQISAACRPIDDKRGTAEYRTDVAAVLAARAVQIAYDRANQQRIDG